MDLLYDLMVASDNEDVKARAKRLLAEAPVRERGTAALRIAYDLRTAETCSAQAALLDRAAAEGDRRAISILSFHAEGAQKGCGPTRKLPCKAKCEAEIAAQMKETIKKINERLDPAR